MSTAVRAPRPLRAVPEPGAGVPLQVAPEPAPSRARRRRRTVAIATGALLGVFALLFGLVAFQTQLIASQQRLDHMRRDIQREREVQERLQLAVSVLSAPDHIVEQAEERLGMVRPGSITYLTPPGDMAVAVSRAAGAGVPPR